MTSIAAKTMSTLSSNKFLNLSRQQVVRIACVTLTFCFTAFSLFWFGYDFVYVLITLGLACAAAITLHKRTLSQKTKQISESSRMHLATVEALATAIDARDQIGMGHVRRTQIYAVGLGNLLGLNEDDINALRTGALLHDIGKLAVPDHILNKPGQLTVAEMEKTKIHSSVGASILEKVGFPYPVVPTVKYHHEFWNGNGYPEGLKGSSIPLTARILSIADAFDALRAPRPYRPARTKADAIKFIRSRAGSQYDPVVVETFLKNLAKFELEIAAQGLDYESNGMEDDQRRLVLDDTHPANYVEQIKQANREVFTLYSLAREFSSSLDLEETLALFAEKVKEFVPYDSIAISLLSDDPEAANVAYAGGLHNSLFEGRKVKLGQGATGYVLKKEKPVINVDPALDLTFTPDESVADYRIMATLPLFADDKLIGAVSLYSCVLENYKDEHIRLLETISHIAADAINASLQHAEAESHALTDPMTGLPNSRSLRSHFDKEVMRASRNGRRFQLVVMDLDGFKAVNDNFGHKTGDLMLKSIGTILKDQLREYDFLARYGGDEFVAIIPETDQDHINSLNERITEAVVGFKLEVSSGGTAQVGVSLGAASYPEHGESLDALIEAADKQMYIAKEGNRRRKQKRQKDVELEALGDLIPADLIPESHYDVEVLEIGDTRAF
jgi:diguanylate cyclase (GGDEF)-like protein/putative nucleotidyltransferase with HDIG domain